MAETHRDRHQTPASPPSDGRQDHDAMRTAAMLPVTGPANAGALAAAGGLNVPGGDPVEAARIAQTLSTCAPRHEPIPGEYDRTTLTHRQPGAMGVPLSGNPVDGDPGATMDDRTKRDRTIEGGGGHG